MDREEREEQKMETSRKIRTLILDNILTHPRHPAPYIADTFKVNRRDVYRELKSLVEEGVLAAEGTTGTRSYRLLKLPEPEVEQKPRPNTLQEREHLERLAWQDRRKR